MNERIVKLITEANAYACTIAEKYVPECGEVNYLWEHAFRKKFAELIVRECMYVLEKNISPLQMKSFVDEYPELIPMSSKELQDRRRNGQIEGLLLGTTAIEEHFGVER
jgi:hypothetical protein